MGLARAHLCVAEAIGYDNFISMWRIYDQEQAYHPVPGALMIPMRVFSSYRRFQRNRVIEALAAEGRSAREIQQRLQEFFCESLSRRRIRALWRRR